MDHTLPTLLTALEPTVMSVESPCESVHVHRSEELSCMQTHNSRNIRNVVKGFFQALANTPTAAEVAEAKGVYLHERVSSKLFHKSDL